MLVLPSSLLFQPARETEADVSGMLLSFQMKKDNKDASLSAGMMLGVAIAIVQP